jgi:hypothetical protein
MMICGGREITYNPRKRKGCLIFDRKDLSHFLLLPSVPFLIFFRILESISLS